MSKRKNGEGTWGTKKIGKTIYKFYRDSDGKYTYGKTQKEIKEKLDKKSSPTYVLDNKTTFGEYINHWHQGRIGVLEHSTYDCYETMIQSMILDFDGFDLSGTQLHNLSDTVFKKYLSALSKEYSHASIRKIWAIIKKCIKYGEVKKEIPLYTTYEVYVPNESQVAVKKKEVPFLSKEQSETFYQTALSRYSNGKPRYGINSFVAIFIMYSGLRVSECIALKWNRISEDRKSIWVKTAFGEMKDRTGTSGKKTIIYEKSTKTDNSERFVPLPEQATAILIQCEDMYPNHTEDDYVFLTNEKTLLDRHNVSRTISSIAKKGKLPENLTAHALRHTYGSILLEAGVDIKKVSELLGHADIRTTYNIYIGVLDKDKRNEVERVFNLQKENIKKEE